MENSAKQHATEIDMEIQDTSEQAQLEQLYDLFHSMSREIAHNTHDFARANSFADTMDHENRCHDDPSDGDDDAQRMRKRRLSEMYLALHRKHVDHAKLRKTIADMEVDRIKRYNALLRTAPKCEK